MADPTGPGPVVLTSLSERHKEILSWARNRSIHIDPMLGRDELPAVKQARAAARSLKDTVRWADEQLATSGEVSSWTVEDADRQAETLRRLRPLIDARRGIPPITEE